MSINIGSFGARLTRDQTVADGVWTKVVFNEVSWDTLGGSITIPAATQLDAPGSSILLQACGSWHRTCRTGTLISYSIRTTSLGTG